MDKRKPATVLIVIFTAALILSGQIFSEHIGNGNVTGVPEVKVYVKGEVVNPGVFELPVTARISDAIEAAGGATENGDISDLDLARFPDDGETIAIPGAEEDYEAASDEIKTRKININTAGVEQLKLIPGIGETLALRIIEYREANGSFEAVGELANVSGIGMGTVERLKERICIE